MVKTIPPWHNYTGPSRKGDFSLPGVTALDEISKEHGKSVKSKTIVDTFNNTIEQSKGNIKADWNFIKSFGWYVLNIIPDLIVGIVGCLIFAINIGLNYINIRRKIK